MSDIEKIRREVSLPNIAASMGVDLERNGNEYEACCPFHEERTPSFTIFAGKDGAWRMHCFGCGAQGDVIDFVEKLQGVTTAEAIKILNGDRAVGRNIQPARIEARDPYAGITLLKPTQELAAGKNIVLYNPKREHNGNITPSAVYPYRRVDGSLIGYVLRHDLAGGGKETPMVCWTRLPGGAVCWSRYPFPKPRPLYGQERITPQTTQVIVVEGEKKVDAIWRATGRVAVSAPGGTNGGRHADWSALKDKKVLIWPDADPEGFKYMAELAEILASAASEIKFIDVVRGYHEGNDVSDRGHAAGNGQAVAHQDGGRAHLVRERGRNGSADGSGRGQNGDRNGARGKPRRAFNPAKGLRLTHADWRGGSAVPKGWDVADAVDEGWGKPEIDGFMLACRSAELPAWPDEPETPAKADAQLPPDMPVDPVEPLEALRREWCFVAGRSVFREIETGAEVKVGAFDLVNRRHIPLMDYLPNGDMLKKPREVSASEWLIGYGFGRSVQDTMYLPQHSDGGPVIEYDGVQYLNSYLPHYVPRAASSWEGHPAVDVWQKHFKVILPDDWEVLLLWLAYNVQHPGKKVLWAPIIKGTQGDGKTTISVMMGAVMGAKNVKVVSTESLFSDFTGYAEGSCVAFLEEIRVKGHNRHDAMNKLKPLVTNAVVDVVRKGQDGRNVPNVTNYCAFTNFDDALVIDENDRRWGVFFTKFQNRAELLTAGIGKAYWDALYDATENHADVLRAWLLSIDCSEFDPKAAPPITAAKLAMIRNSLSAEAVMVAEVIALGREGIGPYAMATDCLNEALRADYGQKLVTTRVSAALQELGWLALEKPMKWNGKARRIYVKKDYEWGDAERQWRTARDMLDATLPGAVAATVLDDPMMEEVPW